MKGGEQPPRPRLADLAPPDRPQPAAVFTEGFEVEAEIGQADEPLLLLIASELGVIVLLLVGLLLTLILR